MDKDLQQGFKTVPPDFELHCSSETGTQVLKVHKLLLMVHSTWFKNFFKSMPTATFVSMEESQETVEEMELLLAKFMYRASEGLGGMDAQHAIKLAMIAEKYDMQHIAERLMSYMCSRPLSTCEYLNNAPSFSGIME